MKRETSQRIEEDLEKERKEQLNSLREGTPVKNVVEIRSEFSQIVLSEGDDSPS